MIRTVSDLLEKLKNQGQEVIKKHEGIKHPGMIGDMYEGLTKDLLDKALFEGLNLKLVSGKITNSKNEYSGQIDCMLVEGDGIKLPYSEKDYIYHFTQVIAVIEVKKYVYSSSLQDSYELLRTVIDVSKEPEKDGENYIIRSLRDSWKALLRMELPRRSELNSYSIIQQNIYHTLLMEAYFPLRIVIGYYGYKSEYAFREAFIKYLESQAKNAPVRRFGAGSLPSLIICGKYSIIKNNGMPYGSPFFDDEYYWPLYVTSNENPFYHLLEIIWTRLAYKYELSSVQLFGNDFNSELVHLFLNAKLDLIPGGGYGWYYDYFKMTNKQLLKIDHGQNLSWEPVYLSKEQFILVNYLCKRNFIDLATDEALISEIAGNVEELEKIIKPLITSGLIFKKDNLIHLLTDYCKVAVLPNGIFCAGEDKNGQFSEWIRNYQF